MYGCLQKLIGREIACNLRGHFSSNFIEKRKKEKFSLTGNRTGILSVRRLTRYRSAIMAWLDRNENAIFAYATRSNF